MNIFSQNIAENNDIFAKIDPRIKLFTAFVILMMILTCKNYLFPLLIFFSSMFFFVKIRVPLKVIAHRFSESLFIAFVIILIKLFSSGGESLFTIHVLGLELTGYVNGLVEGIAMGNRIISAVSVMTLLSFTLPFTEFMASLSWFRVPKDFVDILIFAYRYIFVLFEGAMVIYNSQKNRLGYSNVRRGLNSFGIMAGSLTIKAFEHSQNTTEAMVQRGYDGNLPILKKKPLRSSEITRTLLLISLLGLIWKI